MFASCLAEEFYPRVERNRWCTTTSHPVSGHSYEGFSSEIARSLAMKSEFVCRPVHGMGQPSEDRALRFSVNAYQAGYRTLKRYGDRR
jgi:hypothetical protein